MADGCKTMKQNDTTMGSHLNDTNGHSPISRMVRHLSLAGMDIHPMYGITTHVGHHW